MLIFVTKNDDRRILKQNPKPKIQSGSLLRRSRNNEPILHHSTNPLILDKGFCFVIIF
jgi:hypothetical protein